VCGQKSLVLFIQSAQLQQAIGGEACDKPNAARSCIPLQLTTEASPRRSVLVPTKTMGTVGAWLRSSGIHFVHTLSNDVGHTTEKQRRNTSVSG
jgi:hypothetical protein